MTEKQARLLADLINNQSGMGDIVEPGQLSGRSWGVRLLPGAWIYTTVDQVPDVRGSIGATFHTFIEAS